MPETRDNDIPTLYSLDKKLSQLITMFDNDKANKKEDIDRHQGKLEKHDREFYGDGTQTNPGLKNDMTRVLIIQNISIWVTATIGTGVVGLLINLAYNFFSKHQP